MLITASRKRLQYICTIIYYFLEYGTKLLPYKPLHQHKGDFFMLCRVEEDVLSLTLIMKAGMSVLRCRLISSINSCRKGSELRRNVEEACGERERQKGMSASWEAKVTGSDLKRAKDPAAVQDQA